jgi:hypothetical protein
MGWFGNNEEIKKNKSKEADNEVEEDDDEEDDYHLVVCFASQSSIDLYENIKKKDLKLLLEKIVEKIKNSEVEIFDDYVVNWKYVTDVEIQESY